MDQTARSSAAIRAHPIGPEGPQSAPTVVQREASRLGSKLSEVILGGQDGLVNTMGVILGIAAATSDMRIIIAGGLAATFAESISMAAVAYTSTLADLDFYRAERAREYREIEQIPEMEKREIRDIFTKWGFEGTLLEDMIVHISKNKDHWVDIMMAHELELQPIDAKNLVPTAALVGFSAIVGSFIPLLPFFFFPVVSARWVALVISAVVLFIVGAVKARMTIGHPARSGLQMMLIGMISALAGFAIGSFFGAQPGG
jgi:VIT1/CCC1 family predicted Fe2+/Mn2+ transporter